MKVFNFHSPNFLRNKCNKCIIKNFFFFSLVCIIKNLFKLSCYNFLLHSNKLGRKPKKTHMDSIHFFHHLKNLPSKALFINTASFSLMWLKGRPFKCSTLATDSPLHCTDSYRIALHPIRPVHTSKSTLKLALHTFLNF